jgi:hypothetical protein
MDTLIMTTENSDVSWSLYMDIAPQLHFTILFLQLVSQCTDLTSGFTAFLVLIRFNTHLRSLYTRYKTQHRLLCLLTDRFVINMSQCQELRPACKHLKERRNFDAWA